MFKLISEYEPKGDQPKAIEKLTEGVLSEKRDQVLLGVTGSGKTFSMAHVIAKINRPTLVMAPNKTLAAQLYSEFKELFPENAVEYFVSYYDYYQPEAYLPAQDLYIEKDSAIDERIDKLRHSATHSLLTRRDVIIVASVSCIYGLGSPEAYKGLTLEAKKGESIDRSKILNRLIQMQYERNDYDFHRGTFRVKGSVIDIFPAYEDKKALRLKFIGDDLEKIVEIDSLTTQKIQEVDNIILYPGTLFVTEQNRMKKATSDIREELRERIQYFKKENMLLEAQRIEQRTNYDLEIIEEMGYCKGIENYSRHMTGRNPGDAPPTLVDYFPKDFLLFIDESHITIPQIGGMYRGDLARKSTLVEFGFRLPSAIDNRPLKFEEFEKLVNQAIYVSATPGDFELKRTNGVFVEQLIRPTGLLDPRVDVRKTQGQVDDLLGELRTRIEKNERILVTTLTKRMAEELADYFRKSGIPVRYLHSDIESLERMEILRGLRKGDFSVLVGINLLREGLDLPEVSLVAILDADKEGFLRSARSLIQTFGRAARNVSGQVIMYADVMTNSMSRAIDETNRRRALQEKYNKENNITPETIKKKISDIMHSIYEMDYVTPEIEPPIDIPPEKIPQMITRLKKQMLSHAKRLEFEDAAKIRDEIGKLEKRLIEMTSVCS